MKQALQALIDEMEYVLSCINEEKIPFDGDDFHEALRLGKEALAKQEQGSTTCDKPVAWELGLNWSDLPEEWVGNPAFMEGAKWAEAKLKEKNT
jgi:hypothetical protein